MNAILVTGTRLPAGAWKWTLAYGAVLILAGFAAIGFPFASALAIGLFLGWALCVGGMFGIVAGLRARQVRGHLLDAGVGLLSLVLGLLILARPLAGALTLLWVMSLWFAVGGLAEIATGIRARAERLPLLLSGALDLLLSALLLAGFAHEDIALVALLAGISFLASGLVATLAALRLRHA